MAKPKGKGSPSPSPAAKTVRSGAAPAAVTAPAPVTIPTPPRDLANLVKYVTWPKDRTIHRIHPDLYAADAFNPGPAGNARFSPIADATGVAIPTIYGGTTFACAAMETVFHDVPFAPGLKSVAKRKLKNHRHSQLVPSEDLTLVDLGNKALRKLGITRADLIDSEKNIYPQTRDWAAGIHAQCPDAQGLSWVSRQDDSARAVILFEDRLPPDPLRSVATSVDIVDDASTYAALIDLADEIGVAIIGP